MKRKLSMLLAAVSIVMITFTGGVSKAKEVDLEETMGDMISLLLTVSMQ